MWRGRSQGKRENVGLVVVAVGADKSSQHALKWAADHLISKTQIFHLLHVRRKITNITTPSELFFIYILLILMGGGVWLRWENFVWNLKKDFLLLVIIIKVLWLAGRACGRCGNRIYLLLKFQNYYRGYLMCKSFLAAADYWCLTTKLDVRPYSWLLFIMKSDRTHMITLHLLGTIIREVLF